MKLYALGMATFCLTLCAACSSKAPIPVIIAPQVPPHLLVPVAEPVFQGNTNGALLDWALDTRAALRVCNADKAAIAALEQKP